MRIVVLYHPESEFARSVEEFAHDLERQHSVVAELISLETREGADMAKLYDITSYPAILALREDSQLLQQWIGSQLPLMNEVIAYANR